MLFDCSVDTALHSQLNDAGAEGDAATTQLETATSVSGPAISVGQGGGSGRGDVGKKY